MTSLITAVCFMVTFVTFVFDRGFEYELKSILELLDIMAGFVLVGFVDLDLCFFVFSSDDIEVLTS